MLPKVLLRCVFRCLAVTCVTAVGFRPGYASPADSETPVDLRQAVHSGVELERSHNWLDAIEHYEKSVKSFPDSRELEYGLRRAKIHFGIERRYSDTSFLKTMLVMSPREAMSLFEEVSTKVQSSYVDSLSATSYVAHGTESLYLSLSEQRFLDRNVSARYVPQVSRVRRQLRDEFWNRPISHRDGSRDTINQVCQLMQSQLGISATPVILEYVFGGCNSLDDYSSCLTPGRLNDLYGNIEGQFVGLGIEMKSEAGKGLLLVNVIPDSPAAEAGLLAGEHIVKVDGTDCRQLTTEEAAGLLQGLEGSRAALEIFNSMNNRTRKVTVGRRAVTVKSVPVIRMLDREAGIGYVQLTSFQKTSAQEMDAALTQLRQQGMRSLVWDVRGNPGGLLTTAVEILDRFIGEGVLVSTRGRTSDQNFSYSAHRPGTWDMPLVLLVDGDSASASEIVAGAVRDHRRGTIVGRKSFGKWSVQSIFPISGDSGLRLTTAKFYSPHGHTYGKIGIAPDVAVAAPKQHRTYFRAPTDVSLEGDADVEQALEVLRRQTAAR